MVTERPLPGGGTTTVGGGTAISGGGTPDTGGGTPFRLKLTTAFFLTQNCGLLKAGSTLKQICVTKHMSNFHYCVK